MPELPEVETVRSVLYPYLVGQTVQNVTVNLPKVTANLTPAQFIAAVTGQTITKFTRRGKYLTLHLQTGDRVVVHLRMTGCLTVVPATDPVIKHTNLILHLANGQDLRFEDSRGFGKWWYFTPDQPDTSGQQSLGPEPEQVTAAHLTQIFAHRHAPLKALLLDQHLLAGIGNIYADEICFRCHILPTRPADHLTAAEINTLAQAIPAVLHDFTQKHHVSFAEYAQSQGKSYQTDRYLSVYGRAGQPCPVCRTPLVGTRVGQRSSVFCPECQK